MKRSAGIDQRSAPSCPVRTSQHGPAASTSTATASSSRSYSAEPSPPHARLCHRSTSAISAWPDMCRGVWSVERMFDGYVELHCHSAYSFLDGASMPDELVPKAHELGYR